MLIAFCGCSHGHMPTFNPCDLIIFTGDLEPTINHYSPFQLDWHREEFKPYLDSLPAKKIFHISGNHSNLQYFYKDMLEIYPENGKSVYLRDKMVEFEGVKIFGSPWVTTAMKKWFFGMSEQSFGQVLTRAVGCDILITHQPSLGLGDSCCDGDMPGSNALRNFVFKNQPKIHCHSHIHEGFGIYRANQTTVINCSYLNEKYRPTNKPIYVEL